MMYYDQTVIFMGCRSGEIELGLTYDAANVCINFFSLCLYPFSIRIILTQ